MRAQLKSRWKLRLGLGVLSLTAALNIRCSGSVLVNAATETDTATSETEEVDGAAPSLVSKSSLSLAKGYSANVTKQNLEFANSEVAAENIIYTLVKVPAHGSLRLSNNRLAKGDTFTQKKINDGKLTYVNTDSSQTSDSLKFSVKIDEVFASDASDSNPATLSIVLLDVCEFYTSLSSYNELGSGTEEAPYLLCSLPQLIDLSVNGCAGAGKDADCDKFFQLADDINVNSSSSLLSIGPSATPFTGTFDGNSHTLSNLVNPLFDRCYGTVKNIRVDNITVTSTSAYAGGFMNAGSGATLEDITLTGVSVISTGTFRTGGLAGQLASGTITNVSISGAGASPDVSGLTEIGGLAGRCSSMTISQVTVTNMNVHGSQQEVGGLCGYSALTTIEDSTTSGLVTTDFEDVGGLVGDANSSTVIRRSSSSADVSVVGPFDGSYALPAGGLVGALQGHSKIYDSFATGNVNSVDTGVGGLVGYVSATSSNSIIENCYATGNVTSTDTEGGNWVGAGGLVGYLRTGQVNNSYATGNLTIPATSYAVGGLVGRMGDFSVGRTAVITASFATGTIVSGLNRGGLVGSSEKTGAGVADIDSNSHWDIDSSGEANMCGAQTGSPTGCTDGNGITGNATYFFTSSNTPFTQWDLSATGEWTINEGVSHPTLRWQ